jgi:hypothetical protein
MNHQKNPLIVFLLTLTFSITFALLFCCSKSVEAAHNEKTLSNKVMKGSALRQILQDDELLNEMRKALEGSKDSAGAVVNHFAARSISENAGEVLKNAKLLERWNLIAAENGDLGAMANAAKWLSERHGSFGCSRALFWLNRYLSAYPIKDGQDLNKLHPDIAWALELKVKIIKQQMDKSGFKKGRLCGN